MTAVHVNLHAKIHVNHFLTGPFTHILDQAHFLVHAGLKAVTRTHVYSSNFYALFP